MIVTFNCFRCNFTKTNRTQKANRTALTLSLFATKFREHNYNIVTKEPHLDKNTVLPVKYLNKHSNGLRCSKIVYKWFFYWCHVSCLMVCNQHQHLIFLPINKFLRYWRDPSWRNIKKWERSVRLRRYE